MGASNNTAAGQQTIAAARQTGELAKRRLSRGRRRSNLGELAPMMKWAARRPSDGRGLVSIIFGRARPLNRTSGLRPFRKGLAAAAAALDGIPPIKRPNWLARRRCQP